MVGIVAVLVVVTLSVVATRVGAAALEATGVSADLAHFQARSAFTGVGYTTREAETVADHPARRRIVLTLMLLGNAGIVSVIASLVIGLGSAPTRDVLLRIGILVVGAERAVGAERDAVVQPGREASDPAAAGTLDRTRCP